MRLLIAAQGMQTALMGTLADSPGSDPHASCAATDERFSLEPSSPGGIAALVAQLAAFQEESDEAKLLKREQAVHYAKNLRDLVAHAVNAKYSQLRALQSHVASSDALKSLIYVAQLGEPCGYEALQILCYRNAVVCQQLMEQGIVDKIAVDLPSSSIDLQCAMCHVLTALVAFNEAVHNKVATSGLIPILVSLCRQAMFVKGGDGMEGGEKLQLLQNRAAAVLRNLSHNTEQHARLIQAGTPDALAEIMRHATEPKSRINAALAVAILAGQEENNPRLQLDEPLVQALLEVLQAAKDGVLYHGVFWTVWKVCQGIAKLTMNDANKALITERGGVEFMAEVLFTKHHKNELAHRYALSTLWNLAFCDASRAVIMRTPGLVDAIRNVLATSESPKTKEVAKGALWTLGLDEDVKKLVDTESVVDMMPKLVGNGGHIMLSYEWSCQESVLLIKSELQRAGYQTWMDVDEMSGSTLEAMAQAVEGSAIVLVCISKKYKESQACRTEAEYAFQQRKKIVPLVMEERYKPTGWLGALMGTRLYINMSDSRRIPGKMTSLCKELGTSGMLNSPTVSMSMDVNMTMGATSGYAGMAGEFGSAAPAPSAQDAHAAEGWGADEVERWLKKIGCSAYEPAFRARDMDGLALAGLLRLSGCECQYTHGVLRTDFGMESVGHRLRLVEELHRLFA